VADIIRPHELVRWLYGRKLDALIHLGAISDTTSSDADLVLETNFRLSARLIDWYTTTRTRFIYASSAATYGSQTGDCDDDCEMLARLKLLNLYGFSKHLFDQAVVGH
jgi:ADP-L-glycero-D-manno-heptose 6-epimerase